jgi:hypothetical protein
MGQQHLPEDEARKSGAPACALQQYVPTRVEFMMYAASVCPQRVETNRRAT